MTSLPLISADRRRRRAPAPRCRRATSPTWTWPAAGRPSPSWASRRSAPSSSRTHYFGRLVRDPAAMTDLPGRRPRAARRRAAAHAAHPGARAGLRRRRHPQDAVAAARRRAGRERADGLPGPGHRLRLQPGRLRHGLPVLRHRPGRADPQPVHRRDRRPGRLPRRGGRVRRGAPARRRGCPTSSSWAWASRWPTTPG